AATMAIIDKAFAQRAFAGRDFLRFIFIPVMVVVLGIHDQVPKRLMANRKDVEKLFRQDEEFVRRIELLVPARSMIFQLPYFPFPETWPINNVADYDE